MVRLVRLCLDGLEAGGSGGREPPVLATEHKRCPGGLPPGLVC